MAPIVAPIAAPISAIEEDPKTSHSADDRGNFRF